MVRRESFAFAFAVAFAFTFTFTQRARADEVFRRACESAKAGDPIVVDVAVALCDNRVIPCGSRALGDGEDLVRNLYWGTSEGFFGWMKSRGNAWKISRRTTEGLPRDVLERVVWTRTVEPSKRWRECGVEHPFRVELHVDAWRGTAIDSAVRAFVESATVGAAHVAAYVGHNRWMDYESFDWSEAIRRTKSSKGIIAIACYSRVYLKPWLQVAGHVALVLTNDFVMASGAAAVGAIDAFVDGEPLPAVSLRARRYYAAAQRKEEARLTKVFVNSSSRTW